MRRKISLEDLTILRLNAFLKMSLKLGRPLSESEKEKIRERINEELRQANIEIEKRVVV